MSNKDLELSILMPVFNEENFLLEAVKSIENSSCPDVKKELIIVDDQSQDSTWEIAKKAEKEFDFIKAVKNKEKGKNSAFNLAYQKSSGSYFILLAGDDLLEEDSILPRLSPILKKTTPCVTRSKYRTFSETPKFNNIVIPKNPLKGSSSGGTIAFNKLFADRIFPIPEILGNEDKWINCHIRYSDDVQVFDVPQITLLYRIHSENSLKKDANFSEINTSIHKRSIVYSVFLEKYRKSLPIIKTEELENLSTLENLRFKSNSLSIIFMSGPSLSEKLRALTYSKALFYILYMKLYRYIAGLIR